MIEIWNENSSRTFFSEISKRPVDSNDVVCFKVLTVVHKVLQAGPRQVSNGNEWEFFYSSPLASDHCNFPSYTLL